MTTDPENAASSVPPSAAEPTASAAPTQPETQTSAQAPAQQEPAAEATAAPVVESVAAESAETPVPAETSAPAEPAAPAETVAPDDPQATAKSVPAETAPAAAEGSGARIREQMAAATDALPQPESTVRSTGSSGAVQIPAADDLDASLEAEIAAAQAGDVSAPTATPVAGPTEGAEGEASTELSVGSKIKGVVNTIHGGDVFIDAGLRQTVAVQSTQFPEGKLPAVGDSLEIVIDSVDEHGLIRGRIPRARHRAAGNWDGLAVGQVIDCHVTAVNKGGLQVSVSNLRAFMPASQVELGYAGDLEQYVGQKITAQITEVNPRKRNLVVSRRVLLQAERTEGEQSFWQEVEEGQELPGVVKTLKDYGAFVNIGAVDGFLHIGEISWARINHPRDVLSEGQQIIVKVLKLDREKRRVSLGMKQLGSNPWADAEGRYAVQSVVSGQVTRLTDFGAFVELEPGLEGMVHISELAWRRVGNVSEVLTAGETRDFIVVEVDPRRRRVSLSVKALEKRPEEAAPAEPADTEDNTPDEPRRPRNPNLRGGTGMESGGSGLFGNPSDFS